MSGPNVRHARMIYRSGADWHNPPAPLTAWQRERRDGSLSTPTASVWTGKDMAVSALIFIAIGGFAWIALALSVGN